MGKPSLEGCKRKIDWADQHFQALATEVRGVEEMTAAATAVGYPTTVEFDKRRSIFRVRFISPAEINPAWSLIVGEIIHNLRCALDYLIYELSALESQGTYNEDSQFPIVDRRNDFLSLKAELAGITSGTETRIERHQPYRYAEDIRQIGWPTRLGAKELIAFKQGNEPLRWLRELSNQDKHRLLVEGFFFASPQLHLDPRCIRDCEEPRLIWHAPPPLVHAAHIATFAARITGRDPEMKVDFAVPPILALPEGAGTLTETLDAIAAKVVQIVREFEPAFR